jgi:hypothetical protein
VPPDRKNARAVADGVSSRIKGRIDAAMLSCAKKAAADAARDLASVTVPPWRIHDLRRTDSGWALPCR